MARDEVGVLGVADHQVADLLGVKSDAVEVIAALDSAAFEFALDEVRRDRAALDPYRRDGDDQQPEQREGGVQRDPAPAAAALDHALPTAEVAPLVSRPFIHWAF